MILVSVAILGLIIGSFLNVVIYRYNTGFSLGGRSNCLACGKQLTWYELIPLGSYVAQGGRCRNCQTNISWQYPAVEALTALLFTLVYWHFAPDFLAVLYYWVIVSILVVITVYDLRHTIIPDGLVYTFIFLSFAKPFILPEVTLTLTNIWPILEANILAGVIFFSFFASIWLLSRGRAMGFGDAKLALGIGFLLGLGTGFSALVISFVSGAIIGLILILLSQTPSLSRLLGFGKSFNMKSEVPFAPFLITGLLIVLLFNNYGLTF
jgi:prepilin signal peptidase PulO-like enzyme (type II secretory pathway)